MFLKGVGQPGSMGLRLFLHVGHSKKLNQSESWTIEQIILHETLDAKPLTTPFKFKDMRGRQEIRIKN